MKQYVFFESQNKVWVVPRDEWEQYKYDNEITPLRFAILDMTKEWLCALMEIKLENINDFIDIVRDELNNVFTIHSN